MPQPEITILLVAELIAEQFPQWANLPIKPVQLSGWDNRTFHLGNDMSIRLPSAEAYSLQAEKENKWLAKLAPHLSIPISKPLAMGRPSKNFPWNWSVYRWIEGERADFSSVQELPAFASDLARFLCELHKIDASGGPVAGVHNCYRGGSLSVYDGETRSAVTQLGALINATAVIEVWDKALSSKWKASPVWVHGDYSSGNILVKDGRLAAVIDFGCLGIGDPACDLVIAWTFLTKESRTTFKAQVALDLDTWARARGWALWKALITIASLKDKNSHEALAKQMVIDEILKEHELLQK